MKKDPRLKVNSSMPQGVYWTPVDMTFDRLKKRLRAVSEKVTILTDSADGFVLANDLVAKVSNPQVNNSAVDGYGLSREISVGTTKYRILKGRSAAGEPFLGKVLEGQAIKVLTGASLPEGVDTVVLNEDSNIRGESLCIEGNLKRYSNTRLAGEDVKAGQLIFKKGHRLKSMDLALISIVGISHVTVFRKVRVGIFSTGNEVIDQGRVEKSSPPEGFLFDANRPLLKSIFKRWNLDILDLGVLKDDPSKIRNCLDSAMNLVDVIVTSGGASSGDEDHLAKIIDLDGNMETWKVAIKPGRPLALGDWNDIPVFILPGNPVAAFVCSLIFVKPSLDLIGGGKWMEPQSYYLPAAFKKEKYAGRREFLRARVNTNNYVEVFSSEGSGRISGLSWSDGLVELGDDAQNVEAGDYVKYIPYASFNI